MEKSRDLADKTKIFAGPQPKFVLADDRAKIFTYYLMDMYSSIRNTDLRMWVFCTKTLLTCNIFIKVYKHNYSLSGGVNAVEILECFDRRVADEIGSC